MAETRTRNGRRRGWAHGSTDSGEWLTIAGSAYQAPVLAATAVEAEPSPILTSNVLAYVEETPHGGMTGPRAVAYRILRRVNDCGPMLRDADLLAAIASTFDPNPTVLGRGPKAYESYAERLDATTPNWWRVDLRELTPGLAAQALERRRQSGIQYSHYDLAEPAEFDAWVIAGCPLLTL